MVRFVFSVEDLARTRFAIYVPDLLFPPPAGPLGRIDDDLAALRATPFARVRDDIRLFRSQHPRDRATADEWLAHPRRELGRLADLLEAYWQRAIAPVGGPR